MSGWLEASDWKRVQESMPITCVDVLPVRTRGQMLEQVGLIYRQTPHQGPRWCVVGGRLWRNESLVEAATRQLRETLGPQISFSIAPEAQPAYACQYFTSEREVGLLDPRQHAVTLNYCLSIDGIVKAGGEAIDFRWFDPNELPPATDYGFGQDRVVAGILAAMKFERQGER